MRVRLTVEYEYGGDEEDVNAIAQTELESFKSGEATVEDCLAMDDTTTIKVEVISTADAE